MTKHVFFFNRRMIKFELRAQEAEGKKPQQNRKDTTMC